MQDVDTEWLSWIIIGMGPMWAVKTGDEWREAEAGRTVTASLEDGKGHKECGQLLGATDGRKLDSPMGTQPCPPT